MAVINSTLSNTLLSGTSDDDTIQNGGYWNGSWHDVGSKVTINTGEGNDFVYNYYSTKYSTNVTINSGADNDRVVNCGDKVTINTGAGNDSVWNGVYGDEVTINTGAGNDSVENHGSSVTINTDAGNDYIYIYQGNTMTINGGAGDDLIDNGGNYVTFLYSSGDGNDSIKGFMSDSTLSISGGSYSTTKSGSDIIVTVGDGKITLVGAADLDTLNIIGEEKSTVQATLLTVTDKNSSPVTVGASIKIIDASSRTKAIKITGNALANSITGGSKADSLYGGKGKDTLVGNSGDDKLYGEADNDKLYGGAGSDTLSGGAGKNTLTGGAGADIFVCNNGYDVITDYEAEDKISIEGVYSYGYISGNDVIVVSSVGENITVKGGANKKLVCVDKYGEHITTFFYNKNSGNVITGTSGEDSILNGDYNHTGGENVTINGGAGDDSIDNDCSNVIINGGDGDDFITNDCWNNYIDAPNVLINGGKGNDYLFNMGGQAVTLDGGAGNDFISIDNDNDAKENLILYKSGDGNDIIQGFRSDSTLSIGGGSYSTEKSGSDVIVTVGEGKITLQGAAGLSTVNIIGKEISSNSWTLNGTTAKYGTSDKTLVTVKGVKSLDGLSLKKKVVTVSKASLNKKKVTISDGYTLKLGSDVSAPSTKKAAFSLSGSTATYNSSYKTAGYTLASNSKSISYSKGTTPSSLATIKGASSTSGLSVSGKKITLKNSALKNKVTVSGGYEFNFASDYKKATISGSSNADSIISYGNNLSVNGGKGNDLIRNGDSARAGGAKVSIFGGAGNDTIELWDTKTATVYGGDGNDFIDSSSLSQKILLDGGAGNDSIVNPGSNVTINGGAGNDSIFNKYYMSNGSLVDKSGNYGENVLFKYKLGDGNDKIYGFKSDSTLSISGGEYSDKKSGKDIIVTVGEGKITLVGAATLSKINIAGTKKVTTPATLLTVKDKIKSPVTIDSAIKTVDASTRTKAVKITGNKLANSIVGGKGNDTLMGGAGNDIFIYTAGNDTITDYAEEDAISISSGSAKVTTSGSDVVFTIGNGKITVKNAANKTVTYFDSGGKHTYKKSSKLVTLTEDYDKETYTMGDKLRTLDASAVELDLKIVGNKFANEIIGSTQNDTLIGGKANDTLTGGAGSDVFVWKSGDGNDLITDYAEENIVSINGDTVKNFSVSSEDIIFTLASKSKITIAGGKDKLITYVDDKGEHIYPKIFTVKDKTITLTEEYTKKFFDVSDYGDYKNINASAVEQGLNIVGNSVANSITGTADEDTIDGGTNNDTIRGGDGNDSIFGGKGNDYLYGGEGNDTLWGGAGNDYLEGGEGNDIFVFGSNEGSDKIYGYEQGLDKIMILSDEQPLLEGTPLTDDVTFNVGKGKITILNGAHTAISFIDSKGKDLKPYIPSK